MARLLFPLVALALLAAACSSSSTKSASTTATTAPAGTSASASANGTQAITIQGFAFNPKSVTIKAGTKVTWTNKDTATHTSTSDNGTWDTKSIKPGSSGSFTFTKPGTYTYHCAIHPTMTATIVVT